MADRSRIEWLNGGATWNPVTGCTPVSEGCVNCYARRMANRLRGRCGYPAEEPFAITEHPDRFNEPLRWKRPRMVFACSMGDPFHKQIGSECLDQMIDVMAAASRHVFLMLTKRPERIRSALYDLTPETQLRAFGGGDYLGNLWIGVSCENQARTDERLDWLLADDGPRNFPAALKFVSFEPLLGPIDASKWFNKPAGERLGWVIIGCERIGGRPGRECREEWVIDLMSQAILAGLPVFVKQLERNGKVKTMPRVCLVPRFQWEQVYDEMPFTGILE